MTPEPKITEFLRTAANAGKVEDFASDHGRGSDYESLAGPNAILWSRQAQRDTDLWRSVRFNDAQGEELTRLGKGRYGIDRVLDTRGTGTARLRRASDASGAGMIWRGTRIRALSGGFGPSTLYRVTRDTEVKAGDLTVSVPIQAVQYGPGSKIDTGADCRLEDVLWDATLAVVWVTCSDGTVLEPAAAYRARIRDERLAARVGQEDAIIAACRRVGADNVALFRSDFNGVGIDYGLNFVYVGDLGYGSTPELVRACTLALRAVRVAGDNLQVLPMARNSLVIDADVYLRDSPYVLPTTRLEVLHRRAIIQHLEGRSGSFTYTLSGIETAIARTSTDVQDVHIVSPAADAGVLVNGDLPAVLNRYFAEDANIILRYHGPQ